MPPIPSDLPRDDELRLPMLVPFSSGLLAIAGLFTLMLAFQFSISLKPDAPDRAHQLIAAWYALGGLAFAAAIPAARGRAWGAVFGMVVGALIAATAWLPMLLGVIALSSVLASIIALVALIFLAFCIGPCRRVAAARRRLLAAD